MKELRVTTFPELHEFVQKYEQRFTVFRGVSDISHELIPKIGRKDLHLKDPLEKAEKRMLQFFKERAIPHLSFIPRNDWEWLAVAQHHGLPTRLLDWSRNPLIAAYFAVEQESDTDSALYVWKNRRMPVNPEKNPIPFNITELRKFIPSHVTSRIIAQSGLFTVHPSPGQPMNNDNVDKIVIDKDFRKLLKNILFRYGIHRASLFPDLDGLSNHIIWLNTQSH